MDLLVEAGSVLATSLDLPTTMSQVARLTVPRLGDLCVIDLQAPDGSMRTTRGKGRKYGRPSRFMALLIWFGTATR